MNFINKASKLALSVLTLGMMIAGCQKMDRPALGKYPTDANPPGGPLKFFAAYDGSNSNQSMAAVDSIRANFGVVSGSGSFVSGGVEGNCWSGNLTSYIVYPSANDFGSSTSFTISFWMNITLANKDNVNADGVLALASSNNFWGNVTFYADHTTGGNSDSMDLKMYIRNGSNDNWDFAGYTGNNRWPHMYDGNWHHVVFTYDATSKTGTFYRDGVVFDKKTNESCAFDSSPAQFVVGSFEQAAGVQGSLASNTWMSCFPGKLDNIRLYGVALAASDVQALYNAKH